MQSLRITAHLARCSSCPSRARLSCSQRPSVQCLMLPDVRSPQLEMSRYTRPLHRKGCDTSTHHVIAALTSSSTRPIHLIFNAISCILFIDIFVYRTLP